MSPESFKFTLTLPGDPRLVGVVRDLCSHATGYAELPASAGASFCDQVLTLAEAAVAARPDTPCPLVFDCSDRQLRVTIAGQTVVQPLDV
ncbi:MAG: hypothetical protein R2712_06935 [Vicinamibacterales bacterium]